MKMKLEKLAGIRSQRAIGSHLKGIKGESAWSCGNSVKHAWAGWESEDHETITGIFNDECKLKMQQCE